MKALVSRRWVQACFAFIAIAATLLACSSYRENAPTSKAEGPKASEPVAKITGSLTTSAAKRVGDPSVPADLGYPFGAQKHPGVGYGSGIFLAVWEDERLSGTVIYGARFLEDGTPLDPGGFIIDQDRRASFAGGEVGAMDRLYVTYTDGAFLVTWLDPASRVGRDIKGIRYKVDPTTHALTALDDGAFLIDGTYATRYRVAANASDFIVVFDVQEAVGGYNAYSRLVAGPKRGNANPVGPKTRLTNDSLFHPGYQKGGGTPLVASNGDEFLVLTRIDDDPNYGYAYRRLNASGQPIEEPKNNLFSGYSWDARLLYLNGRYHLFDAYFWSAELIVSEFTEAGVLLDLVDGHPTYAGQYKFADGYKVTYSGASDANAISLVLTRADNVDCVMRFVDTSNFGCVPIGPSPSSGADFNEPIHEDRAAAIGPNKTFAVLTTNNGNDVSRTLFSSTIAQDAGLPPSAPLSTMGKSEGESSSSYDGKGTFVVWAEGWNADFSGFTFGSHGSASKILGAYFDENGTRLTSPVLISSGAPAAVTFSTTIFDGNKHYATWIEVSDKMRLMGRTAEFVNGALSLGAITEITSAAPSQGEFLVQTAMASDGVNRIVVFIKGLLTLPNSQTGFVAEVFGKRVSIANDAVLDVDPVILSDGTFAVAAASPAIACDKSAGQCVVGWAQAAQSVLRHVHGVVIKKGEIAPAAPSFYFQNTAGAQFMLGLASSDTGAGIATFIDYGTDGLFMINAKVFDFNHPEKVDATVRATPVSATSGDNSFPSVAYMNDGASFTIAWSQKSPNRAVQVRAASVALDGRVLDPEGVVISSSSNDSDDCATISPSAPGKATVVYSHLDLSPTEGGPRIEMRSLASGKFVSDSCETNDQCATRHCAGDPGNKVCCDTACDDPCGTCVAVGQRGTCVPRGDSNLTCGFDRASRCVADSATCPATCAAANQCAPGAECKLDADASVGECLFTPITCFDETAEKGPDGSRVQCGDNLKCSAGKCLTSCGSVDDCTGGLFCQVDGKCVAAPSAENEDGTLTGCDCSFGQTSGKATSALGFALGALLIGRRRISRRRSA